MGIEVLYKSKYLKISGLYPLKEDDIINVNNGKDNFILRAKHNDSLYKGELLYSKRKK